uniref:Uncharacterized protein n=1 Tax=Lepeophtheirus salmonis TaxID=72036 RepID=A0A0K2UIN4_LEPSM
MRSRVQTGTDIHISKCSLGKIHANPHKLNVLTHNSNSSHWMNPNNLNQYFPS